MNIHDKTTAMRMAACAALGLHYWSGHPQAGCVWAVDDDQQPHGVRIYQKDMTAAHQTAGYSGRLYDDGPRVSFEVPERSLLIAS